MTAVKIEYLYLDLTTCDRCVGTDAVLERTIEILRPALETAGYDIHYEKKEIYSAEIAENYRLLSSPTIRVNGADIFEILRESNCGCCGNIAGTDIDCRVVEWKGKEYEVPTEAVLADAILTSIFAPRQPQNDEYSFPENLRRFFEGKKRLLRMA